MSAPPPPPLPTQKKSATLEYFEFIECNLKQFQQKIFDAKEEVLLKEIIPCFRVSKSSHESHFSEKIFPGQYSNENSLMNAKVTKVETSSIPGSLIVVSVELQTTRLGCNVVHTLLPTTYEVEVQKLSFRLARKPINNNWVLLPESLKMIGTMLVIHEDKEERYLVICTPNNMTFPKSGGCRGTFKKETPLEDLVERVMAKSLGNSAKNIIALQVKLNADTECVQQYQKLIHDAEHQVWLPDASSIHGAFTIPTKTQFGHEYNFSVDCIIEDPAEYVKIHIKRPVEVHPRTRISLALSPIWAFKSTTFISPRMTSIPLKHVLEDIKMLSVSKIGALTAYSGSNNPASYLKYAPPFLLDECGALYTFNITSNEYYCHLEVYYRPVDNELEYDFFNMQILMRFIGGSYGLHRSVIIDNFRFEISDDLDFRASWAKATLHKQLTLLEFLKSCRFLIPLRELDSVEVLTEIRIRKVKLNFNMWKKVMELKLGKDNHLLVLDLNLGSAFLTLTKECKQKQFRFLLRRRMKIAAYRKIYQDMAYTDIQVCFSC